jgi:hypothetical protein
VLACIDACAALDSSGVSAAAPDAGVRAQGRCPEPPFPCERLCWELEARGGASGEADLVELGAPAIRCALQRASECHAAAAAGALLPGAAEAEPVSWTRAFLECAGSLAGPDGLE